MTAGACFNLWTSVAFNTSNLVLINRILIKGVMLVCSMFYTRTEIGERITWSVNSILSYHSGAGRTLRFHDPALSRCHEPIERPSLICTYNGIALRLHSIE